MAPDEIVVQTELSIEEYERLCELADRDARSLEGLLRTAALECTRRHFELEPDDPLFTWDPDGTTGQPLSATHTDQYLYDTEE